MVMHVVLALGVAALAALGEWLHARRTRRVARLAFGHGAMPRAWARAAPALRVAGLAAAVFGAAILAAHDPRAVEQEPSARASKQVLIALDVSPSMLIEDAGPEAERVSRSRWAGTLVQGVLDRLNMKETRITLVAFYTDAVTVLEDSTDKEIISNLFDGLQLHVAFDPGPTDLRAGIDAALEIARPWARDSTTLVVVSDGDASANLGSIRLPPAIADAIVIGVGDPGRATVISGHSSKQEVTSLRALAAQLGGHYHEGNRLNLPSRVLDGLTMISPSPGERVGMRDLALICVGAGCSVTALVGPLLMLAGTPRHRTRTRDARAPATGRAARLATKGAA